MCYDNETFEMDLRLLESTNNDGLAEDEKTVVTQIPLDENVVKMWSS